MQTQTMPAASAPGTGVVLGLAASAGEANGGDPAAGGDIGSAAGGGNGDVDWPPHAAGISAPRIRR